MSDNDGGLSIIYKGGYVSDLAICIDPTELFYGWLLARNPLDGRWVSLTKIGANATTLYEARNRIAELEAELAAERERRGADETDAARYRWLREWRARWEIRYWNGIYWNQLITDELGAAIDAARGKEQK